MLGRFGYAVSELHRTRFGPITLEGMDKPGSMVPLTAEEEEMLLKAAGIIE